MRFHRPRQASMRNSSTPRPQIRSFGTHSLQGGANRPQDCRDADSIDRNRSGEPGLLSETASPPSKQISRSDPLARTGGRPMRTFRRESCERRPACRRGDAGANGNSAAASQGGRRTVRARIIRSRNLPSLPVNSLAAGYFPTRRSYRNATIPMTLFCRVRSPLRIKR